MEASFNGKNAKAFMSKQGYDLKPTLVSVKSDTYTSLFTAGPKGNVSITTGKSRILELEGKYVRNSYVVRSRQTEKMNSFKITNPALTNSCHIKQSYVESYTYGKKTFWNRIGSAYNVYKKLTGNHDYTNKKITKL